MHMCVSEQFVFIFMFNRLILKYVYKHCRFYVIDINSIHLEFQFKIFWIKYEDSCEPIGILAMTCASKTLMHYFF